MGLARSHPTDSKMASLYFECSCLLSDIMDQNGALKDAIDVLVTAIKQADNDNYWNLKLIFKLAVSFL